MKILFLHPNFPAQFKNLAQNTANTGHDVKFLCQTHYGREITGVDRLTLKNKAGYKELNRLNQSILERTTTLSTQYRQGLLALKKAGWSPDLVISHSGWGCGTYVKEVWPKCRQISYLEWWFDPESEFLSYDTKNENLSSINKSFEKQWLRNQSIALELSISDAIVTPTQWQYDQLPKSLRDRTEIIFDGIDLCRFKSVESQNIRKNTITYGTRGMDPMRCFPQLIMSLPALLSRNRNLKIEIAGTNEAFYGATKAPDGISWKEWAQHYLKSAEIEHQVSWVGRLKPGIYEQWLKTSQCHIYLTHPFVASWSLVESYCCGVPIVASDVKPVQEICSPSDDVNFVDHRKEDFLANSILETIEMSSSSNRKNVVSKRMTQRYGLEEAWSRWRNVSHLQVTTKD